MLASLLNAILGVIYCFDFYISKNWHETGAQSFIQTLKGQMFLSIVIFKF